MGELKVKFLMGPSDCNDANIPNYSAEFLGNLSRALGEKVVCAEMDEVRAQPLPVYFIASGGAEPGFAASYQQTHEPYILLTTPAYNSLAAAMEIMGFLQEKGLKGEILHGTPEAIARRLNVLKRVAEAREKLSHMKLGCFGEPGGLIASDVDFDKLKALSGMECRMFDLEEVVEEFHKGGYPENAYTKELKTRGFDPQEVDKALSRLQSAADKLVKKNDDTMNSTGKGVLTEIYVDTDAEETTVVVINTYLAEVAADYNTKTEDVRLNVYTGVKAAAKKGETPTTISTTYTVESEDVDGLEKLKEDDMVLVTIAKGDVMTVTPVETVKDVAITSYSTDYADADKKDEYKLTKLTAGGNKYETAKKAFEDAEVLYDYNVEQLDDATFDLYLDPYGYVIGARQVDGDDNFIFVVGYDRSSTVLAKAVDKALAIFTDGTMKTIDVKSGDLKGGRLAESATTNTWFKYTVKDGVYNLEEVADMQIKDSTTTKLDKQNNTVEQVVGGKKTIAYGNNDTVLIAVKADDDVIDEGSIVKVEGVTTGIKHSSVEVKYDSKLSNFDGTANTVGGDKDNMIFALYNKNGYITYAVVVGKTAGSSESMVYLTSGIKSKSLENGDYIYTYEAITKDGAVTVNSFESKDNSTPRANLVLGNLYEGTFDKNNVITEMEKQTNTDSGKWNTKQYKDDGYALLNVADKSELTAKGATLWIDDAASNDKYILLDEDCKIFVRASDDDEDDYTEYSNIKSALSALGETSDFTGTIAAFVNDAGIATTLILNDTYKANDKPNTNPSKPTSTDVDSVKLTIKGSKGLIELFNKKGDALTDTTVKHSFELYQYVAGQNNYVKVDEGDYFYGVTPAFSVAGGNSYYVVIDGVQSNIARA